jgi:aspartate/methionine/tyrosine aminotransferase
MTVDPRSAISRRVSAIAPSATLAVDAKAKALIAAGEPVIGFGAGEPDFPTPAHIVDAAVVAAADPATHRYSPAAGLPALRSAVAAVTLRGGAEVDPSQVVITNGGKHAIYNAMAVLLNDGDEVLLPAPYWTTYPEPIRLAGGVPVVLPTDVAAGFKVTVEQLEAARTPATKALVFVSPSNPTGVVYTRAETEAIGRWALEHGIWVITDEIYEHLVFGDHVFTSMPVVVPELAEQCIIVNGVAKTYAMTGWRVGWIVAPGPLAAAAANLQSHQTSNVCNVAQRAALAALEGGLGDVERMREAFERRGRRMHEMLAAIDGVTCLEPQGAFYCFPDVRAHLGRTISGRSVTTTAELADVALDEAKVAVVPGEAFDAPGYLRLSFALGDDDIVEGVSRLGALLSGS